MAISFSFLITTKINNTTNRFLGSTHILSISLSDSSNSSNFIDLEQKTFVDLIEKPLSNFQVCDITK